MDEGNELETLLVLCCLVGVIVFLCFSLSAVNLSAQIDVKPGAAANGPADLKRISGDLQRDIASLTSEAERLAKEIDQRKSEPAQTPVSAPKDRAPELASLQKQLDEVSKTIERLNVERERLRQAGIERSEREREQGSLKETLEQLKGQVEEKRKALAAIPVSVDPSMETDLRRLRDSVAGLDKEIGDLSTYLAGMTEEPGTINIRRHLSAGPITLKSPVIVECKKDGIVFYPGGKTVTLDQLKTQDPFQQLPGKPDGILVLIRPDGFEVFLRTYEHAKKTKLPIIREAVDANWKLKL
jgi:prefoldin subunit 5